MHIRSRQIYYIAWYCMIGDKKTNTLKLFYKSLIMSGVVSWWCECSIIISVIHSTQIELQTKRVVCYLQDWLGLVSFSRWAGISKIVGLFRHGPILSVLIRSAYMYGRDRGGVPWGALRAVRCPYGRPRFDLRPLHSIRSLASAARSNLGHPSGHQTVFSARHPPRFHMASSH